MHDAETGEHIDRMASVAAFLACKVGLDRDRVLLLRVAAPMHDVGKVATPDGILRKTGPLTAEEREEMQRHTTVGYQILADSESELLRLAATIALTTTSTGTAAAIRRGWSVSGFRSRAGSPRWPTSSTLCSVTAATGRRCRSRRRWR